MALSHTIQEEMSQCAAETQKLAQEIRILRQRHAEEKQRLEQHRAAADEAARNRRLNGGSRSLSAPRSDTADVHALQRQLEEERRENSQLRLDLRQAQASAQMWKDKYESSKGLSTAQGSGARVAVPAPQPAAVPRTQVGNESDIRHLVCLDLVKAFNIGSLQAIVGPALGVRPPQPSSPGAMALSPPRHLGGQPLAPEKLEERYAEMKTVLAHAFKKPKKETDVERLKLDALKDQIDRGDPPARRPDSSAHIVVRKQDEEWRKISKAAKSQNLSVEDLMVKYLELADELLGKSPGTSPVSSPARS